MVRTPSGEVWGYKSWGLGRVGEGWGRERTEINRTRQTGNEAKTGQEDGGGVGEGRDGRFPPI